MTRSVNRDAWGKVSGYEVPLTGVLPKVLTASHSGEVTASASSYSQAVYREDLVREVAMTVRRIENLLREYSHLEHLSIAGLIYHEAPDDASYQDAYEWEPASVVVFEDTSIPNLQDNSSDVWR